MWCVSDLHADWRNRANAGMRVTICDTGTGIDRATAARIFEPFFTTKPDTGTGLGLWVVAQLIERHEGAVRVRSSQRPELSGTVFSVFLPFRRENADEGSIDKEQGTTTAPPPSDPVAMYTPGLFLQPQYA